MKYQKTVDGVVVQVQPDMADGFIECPDSVHCGMLFDGTNYSQPDPVITPPPTHDEIYDKTMQNSQLLLAIVKSINKGTLVTGANKTGAELKAIIKAQMNGI